MAENKNNPTKTPSQPSKPPVQKQDRGGFGQDSKRHINEGHVVTSTMPAPKPKVGGK